MKQGINLATRSSAGRDLLITVGWLVLILSLAGTVIHAGVASKAYRECRRARSEIGDLDKNLETLTGQTQAIRQSLSTPTAQEKRDQLVVLRDSGALSAPSPTRVLTLLSRAFPSEARALSVRLDVSGPSPELVLDIAARSPNIGSELVAELAQSPFVSVAEILEERHASDGGIRLRVQAELKLSETIQ